jgi:hypothetical protein
MKRPRMWQQRFEARPVIRRDSGFSSPDDYGVRVWALRPLIVD